jgi:hypothetical protein
MTKEKKFTSVENAEKSSMSKPEKPDKPQTDEVQELIKGTKIEPSAIPSEPEKAKRGRPPKKTKPQWNAGEYAKNPIATTINDTIRTTLNKTILKDDPIKPEEIQIGEAIAYTLDYYLEDIPITHPIFVMVFVTAALILTIINKKAEKPKKGKEQEQEEIGK